MNYKVRQRLDSWDLKFVLVILLTMGLVRLFGWGSPASSPIEIVACIILVGAALYALQSTYLKIKVNRKGVKFRRQWWKAYQKISWKKIKKVRIVQNMSTVGQSGVGVQMAGTNEIEQLVRHTGIEIHLKDGSKTFIGLKHPEEIDFRWLRNRKVREKIYPMA